MIIFYNNTLLLLTQIIIVDRCVYMLFLTYLKMCYDVPVEFLSNKIII